MIVYIVEVRKHGSDEWDRMWTFSNKATAESVAKVARRAIDVVEVRIIERA